MKLRTMQIPLLESELASIAARSLFVARPYQHLPQDAIEPWFVFHRYDVLDRVKKAIISKLPDPGGIKCVAAASYWGFPLAVSLATEFHHLFGVNPRCLCFGEDVFSDPIQSALMLKADLEDAIVVDDVVHRGGNIKNAVAPNGNLAKFGYRAVLAAVILDQDVTPDRRELNEILRNQLCPLYTVTRTTLISPKVRFKNYLRSLQFHLAE
jgi:orotate phosphoribosyltransferase